MKVLKFLTSRVGAVSKAGALGMGLTVGLVGLNVYNYVTERPAAQEQQIRSLSDIMMSGGALPVEYSGINISRGSNEFATAEERAAREGTLFDGGEAAVAALGGINGISVRGSALGQGESGLGMGANAAVQMGPDGKPLTGNVNADGSGVAAAAAEQANKTKINKLGESKEGDLQRASMARASGSNLSGGNGAFGAQSGSSTRGAAARAEARGRMGASSISGRMPEGSTLVAANNSLRGATSSSFVAGGRETRVGHGINSKEGNSLRQIAVDSSKVAANRNRAANEGASPFMADTKLSGGVNVVGETANTGGSSVSDFEDKMDAQEKGAAQAIDDIDTTEAERQAHRSRLAKSLVALLFATITAMIAISVLKDKWPWGFIAAIAVSAAMAVSIGLFLKSCFEYSGKYDADTASTIFKICGFLFAAAVGIAWINKVSGWISKIIGKVGTGLGLGEGFATGTGVGGAVGTVKQGVTDAIQAGKEGDGGGLSNG